MLTNCVKRIILNKIIEYDKKTNKEQIRSTLLHNQRFYNSNVTFDENFNILSSYYYMIIDEIDITLSFEFNEHLENTGWDLAD